jgi:hypothetical protein
MKTWLGQILNIGSISFQMLEKNNNMHKLLALNYLSLCIHGLISRKMEACLLLVMHKNLQFGGGLVVGALTSHELQCTTKEESNVMDQLAPNKKNMPPKPKSQPQHKSARVIRQLTTLRSSWRTKYLGEAMDAIERGFTSLRKASWYWNIPLTSLLNPLIDKTMSRKRGPLGVLSTDEEVAIIEWVFGIQEWSLLISLH